MMKRPPLMTIQTPINNNLKHIKEENKTRNRKTGRFKKKPGRFPRKPGGYNNT
jgi:hypothetical protein